MQDFNDKMSCSSYKSQHKLISYVYRFTIRTHIYMQSQVLEQNDSQLKKHTLSLATDTMPDESHAKRPRLQDTEVHTTHQKLFIPGAGGEASPAFTVSDK